MFIRHITKYIPLEISEVRAQNPGPYLTLELFSCLAVCLSAIVHRHRHR